MCLNVSLVIIIADLESIRVKYLRSYMLVIVTLITDKYNSFTIDCCFSIKGGNAGNRPSSLV